MARILCTGITTLDHVADVETFPMEDSEQRGERLHSDFGGNASNTARVLAHRGHEVWLASVLPDDASGNDLEQRIAAAGIGFVGERRRGTLPTSLIWRARDTGSRTIVHVRDLPETSPNMLEQVDATVCDWFHFEGRNVAALETQLAHVEALRVDQPISLELEKPRDGLLDLAARADVLLVSAPFARALAESHNGAPAEPQAFVGWIARRFGSAVVTLTGGSRGAWVHAQGRTRHVAPAADLVVVDSLGAGDCFNAGIIDALASGAPPETALQRAVRLAERKLAVYGWETLSGPPAIRDAPGRNEPGR